MTQIARSPGNGLAPLGADLAPQVHDFAQALRMLFLATGLTQGEFVALSGGLLDKGSLSRYLNGKRVPRQTWLLDKLLALQAGAGKPVTEDVRGHLMELQLQALEVAHPHAYMLRRVEDALTIAVTAKQEAERYNSALEDQLAERNRRVEQLTTDLQQLRSAWGDDRRRMQAERDRLAQEISDLNGQLSHAKQRAVEAEQRCKILEDLHERLQITGEEGGAPAVWGRIPPPNRNFTGRKDLIDELRLRLSRGPSALVGLHGVGKTALAVEYAHSYRQEYDVVWWIPADQPVLVRSSLAGLAPALGLPPPTASGIEDAANAVLDALRLGAPYSRWLLIFDNADQPEDLNDIIPRRPGDVIVTSSNPRWDGVLDVLPVDVFTPWESVEFINKRVRQTIDPADIQRLGEDLGHLPLALEQAGAQLEDTGMSMQGYRRMLYKQPTQLLSEGKPTEYPVALAAAWSVSIASLHQKMPEAVDLLRVCAFFDSDTFLPEQLEVASPTLDPQVVSLISDPIRLSRAVGELARYALIQVDGSSHTAKIPQLIRRFVRDEVPPEKQDVFRQEALALLPSNKNSTTTSIQSSINRESATPQDKSV